MVQRFVLTSWLLCVALSSCGAPAEPPDTVNRWLDSRAGVSALNLGGAWTDSDWGSTYFQQHGNRLSGKLGAYTIYGSISGIVVSLAIYSGGVLNYTATLQMTPDGALLGKYFRTTQQTDGWPILLRRAQ